MAILTVDYSSLNHEEMAAAIGLKPKHIPMLIGSFLEESETILKALNAAIDSNDFTEIKGKAHSIKGSSGNLKFTEVYEMTKEMELAASNLDGSFDYRAYFDAVKSAVATISN